MKYEKKLDYLFEAIYDEKDMEAFYNDVLTQISPSKTSSRDILEAIAIFIKITGPKNLGDFFTIINPNTGFIDLKTSKLIYALLKQLEDRHGREALEEQLTVLFNQPTIDK